MEQRGIFTEEVIHSWAETGIISTTFSPDEARERILLALENTIRFNGMMNVPWSVLSHSWMVGVLAEDFAITARCPEERQVSAHLMGMLHDLGEAIVGDMVWPLKAGRFKDVYDGSYLLLENAFRDWAGEYAFGIPGFPEKYAGVEEFVAKADALMGNLEMFGASGIADYGFAVYAGPFFSQSVGRRKFMDGVEFFKERLR